MSDRPILPWRFVAGVLLHLALPIYVVTVAVVLMVSHRPLLLAPALRLTLGTSAWFVSIYGLLTFVLAAGARYADPILRRRRIANAKIDPAVASLASEQRVVAAAAATADMAASRDDAAVRIRDAVALLSNDAWRHGDKAYQKLSSDLAMAVGAFVAAFGAGDMGYRTEVRLLAAAALERLAAELRRLNDEHNRLDHGDAKVAARYIELRYGPDELSSDGPD